MMKSIKTIYKTGVGPSSSHSMGPKRATRHFLESRQKPFARIRVELYGSLAATGKGHLTDKAIESELTDYQFEMIWKPDTFLPFHPCGMKLAALEADGSVIAEQLYFSVGGGELADEDGKPLKSEKIQYYPVSTIREVLAWCQQNESGLYDFVAAHEAGDLSEFLEQVWQTMTEAVGRGLSAGQAVLPGCLKLPRRASRMREAANEGVGVLHDLNLLSSYALAVSEENASGNVIVTAPTCGACGVMPAILYYFHRNTKIEKKRIIQALAVAGLFGSSIAARASISGAEIGCQGEVGTACAMSAAAAAFLMGGSSQHIEYAAEMALEHMLGLTCDPIAGLVQIPCIERNAFAAMRALECASYALATNGIHSVGFDDAVDVMKETGLDLQAKYKETAIGGLAKIMKKHYLE